MVDCSECINFYSYNDVYFNCKYGLFENKNPISCSGFKKKDEEKMEVEIKSKKIKSIKIQNGKMECVGDVFQITGDFVIEFNVEEE